MAQTLTNQNGSTVRPGAYPDQAQVVEDVTGIATSGIMLLLGEADAGPGYLDEVDLAQNFYTPDQYPLVRAKYRSGHLVDAFFGAAKPSQDRKLPGSPSAIYVLKTNRSTRAQATLLKLDGATTYHYLADKGYGSFGNIISYEVAAATSEVPPTTGQFTLLVPNNTTDTSFRSNGGSSVAYQFSALSLPSANVTAINALSGVDATGGADRSIITVTGNLTVAATGNQVTITRSVAWAATPEVGDTLYIPSGSAIQGGTNANRGSYVVTAATSTTVTATKLLDASGGAGALTPPEAVGATAIAATTDLRAFSPVTISQTAATAIDGVGKSLEWNELTTSTGRLTDLCYALSTTKSAFVSTASAPSLMTSAAEYQVTLADAMALDNVTEVTDTVGGEVVLGISYAGTTATVTTTATALTTSVTGGSGANLTLPYSTFRTIADLAAYVNAQPGYKCTVLLPFYGNQAPGTYLDKVSGQGICTTTGNLTGRLKIDAKAFFDAVQSTALVQLGTSNPLTDPQPAAPTGNRPAGAGLPLAASGFLAGGAKAGTTQAQMVAAIERCEKLIFNFGCLLISQDASVDITEGETESTSTYQLEPCIIKARQQAEALSTQFRRKPRQWFAGIEGSYVAVQRPMAIRQSTVGLLALTIQDIRALSADGTIKLFQPWYGAMLAAAMQAGAFSKGIVHREPSQNGVSHRYGDFDAGDDGQVSNALRSGICVLSQGMANPGVPGAQGRWMWDSDQTAYVRDSSFFYNSIQARYIYDIVRMTVALGTEDAVVGESSADVDAVLVKKIVESFLSKCVDLKLLAKDDEAPRGWVNVLVEQDGPVFKVEVIRMKLAGLVYFVDLRFSVAKIKRRA